MSDKRSQGVVGGRKGGSLSSKPRPRPGHGPVWTVGTERGSEAQRVLCGAKCRAEGRAEVDWECLSGLTQSERTILCPKAQRAPWDISMSRISLTRAHGWAARLELP